MFTINLVLLSWTIDIIQTEVIWTTKTFRLTGIAWNVPLYFILFHINSRKILPTIDIASPVILSFIKNPLTQYNITFPSSRPFIAFHMLFYIYVYGFHPRQLFQLAIVITAATIGCCLQIIVVLNKIVNLEIFELQIKIVGVFLIISICSCSLVHSWLLTNFVYRYGPCIYKKVIRDSGIC